MTNVVDLHSGGGKTPYAGEPQEGCIALLEEALERARSGEIQAVFLAFSDKDGAGGYRFGGLLGSYSLFGAIYLGADAISEQMRD